MRTNSFEFFELVRSREKAGDPLEYLLPVEVEGRIERVFLDYENKALIDLEADSRGLRFVRCRCLSEKVLRGCDVGDVVTVKGELLGMEDSLTVTLIKCELRKVGRAVEEEGAPPFDPDTAVCLYCGRSRREAHMLIPTTLGALCDKCATTRLRQGRKK